MQTKVNIVINVVKTAKEINLGKSTKSTVFVAYINEITSKGNAIKSAFIVPVSDCLACDFKEGFDMKIIALHLFANITKHFLFDATDSQI